MRSRPIADRLSEKLSINEDECWIFNGAKTPKGYGLIAYKGIEIYTHRITYELHIGPIPEGMLVCHTCDVPSCCNPSHLFLGTSQDNVDNMMDKGREGKFGLAAMQKLRG